MSHPLFIQIIAFLLLELSDFFFEKAFISQNYLFSSLNFPWLFSKKRILKTFSQDVGQQQTVNKWQFDARDSDDFEFGILMATSENSLPNNL